MPAPVSTRLPGGTGMEVGRAITAREAALLLGRSTAWMLDEMNSGRVEHTRAGDLRLFTPAQWSAYVEQLRRPARHAA